jgi:hypothetical protein
MHPKLSAVDDETAKATIDEHDFSMASQLLEASMHLVFLAP